MWHYTLFVIPIKEYSQQIMKLYMYLYMYQTFFSFLPKANPGDPFSTNKQEIPFGPGSPVLHMTT